MPRSRLQRCADASAAMERTLSTPIVTRSVSRRLAEEKAAAALLKEITHDDEERAHSAPPHAIAIDTAVERPLIDAMTNELHKMATAFKDIEQRIKKVEQTLTQIQTQASEAHRQHDAFTRHMRDANAAHKAFDARLSQMSGAIAALQSRQPPKSATPPPKIPAASPKKVTRPASPKPLPVEPPRRSQRIAARRTAAAFDEENNRFEDECSDDDEGTNSSDEDQDIKNLIATLETMPDECPPPVVVPPPSEPPVVVLPPSGGPPVVVRDGPHLDALFQTDCGPHEKLHLIVVEAQQLVHPTHAQLDQLDIKHHLPKFTSQEYPSKTAFPDADLRHAEILRFVLELFRQITSAATRRGISPDQIYAEGLPGYSDSE